MKSGNLAKAEISFAGIIASFLVTGFSCVFHVAGLLLALCSCCVTAAYPANTFNEPKGRFALDLPEGSKLADLRSIEEEASVYSFEKGPDTPGFVITWLSNADKPKLFSFGCETAKKSMKKVVQEGSPVDSEVNGNPAAWVTFRGKFKGVPVVALVGAVSLKRCGSSHPSGRCGVVFNAFLPESKREKQQSQAETAFRSIRDVGSPSAQAAKGVPPSGGETAKKSESQPPQTSADELPKAQSTEGRLVTREVSLGKPPAEFFASTLPGEHMDYRAMLIPLTYSMLPGQPGKWVTVPRGPGNIERVYVSGGKASWGGAAVAFSALLFAAAMEAREQEQIRRYYGIGPGSLRVSPDSGHVAYGVARGKNRAVAVDGKEGSEYERIVLGSLFSPDGKRFAYSAEHRGKWVVVVDGVEGKEYEEMGAQPVFSPDSTRVAYSVERGGKRVVVVDGKEEKEYRSAMVRHPLFRTKVMTEDQFVSMVGFGIQHPVFSPDSKRVAYVAKSGMFKMAVVLDGVEQKGYGWMVGQPIFSPDSKRVAHVAMVQLSKAKTYFVGGFSAKAYAKYTVVVDGVEGAKYDEILKDGPVFSPDGKRVAFAGKRGGKWAVVVDGVEGKEKEYDKIRSVSFTPDSKRVGYVAKKSKKWVVVEEGGEGKEYDDSEATLAQLHRADDAASASVADAIEEERSSTEEQGQPGSPGATRVSGKVLSADGKHAAYTAARGEKRLMVVDGVEGKEYDVVLDPALSADGKRFAYRAERRGKWVAVVDGVEGKEYAWVEAAAFSPDSKRVGYVACRGDNIWGNRLMVVDGVEGKDYLDVSSDSLVFSPDSKRVGYVALRGDKPLVVVDGVEGREYDEIRGVTFSPPDSKQVSYLAKKGKKWVVVKEGVEGREYDDSEATLAQLRSADDATSASVAEAIEKERSSTEAQAQPGSREVTRVSKKVLSPDGKHAAYTAARGGKCFMVVDGIESTEYDYLSPPVFDGPTSLHAVALRDQEFFRVEIQVAQ